ncbi:MAG: TIGR03960 family B12-binding radical SAM protein [Lachnospiraceae bacterium]|nr:TIGR03960 family B12-binding radical SAM protein [Lachnospiraceae bacterium]
MRKLALSDEILLTIDKPARYIGQEINAVSKNVSDVDIRFVMCFPDVYEIGMSHLGIQILYDRLNRYDDVWCERVYSPWMDLDEILRKEQIPLFALESQDPIRDFDFLGITLQYEMCYTNVLQILDLSGIALRAKDRRESDPIVIGGGPCSYNPEPIADFFDLFYIGEGEEGYRALLDLYKECKAAGLKRVDFLKKAAKLAGIYCPMFYEAHYNEDGTLKEFVCLEEGLPERIEKTLIKDLNEVSYPKNPIVPYMRVTQDRVVLEIQRGCIRGCRFCQAGMLYRPVRERSVDYLMDYATTMLDATGHEEISLSSLSSSDYSHLPELMDRLIDECTKRHVNISLPSLRIDAFSLDVMNKVQDVKKSSLTFAPEAGSQRMRNVINKGLTVDDIMGGAKMAFSGGWNKVKLYFMLGLPFETDEDAVAIAELADQIARLYYETVPKEERTGKVQITASSSFFIPKPFTPLQWAPMGTKEDFLHKADVVKSAVLAQLNKKSIRYMYHEADVSVLEGVFARGDRRLSDVIEKAYKKGCFYDAWGEYYHHDVWLSCFEECGLDVDFYTTRVRKEDELFPWDFISCGVTKAFLLREWKNAAKNQVTPNCSMACSGCGAACYGTGEYCPK